jgi:PKD repeat protein
MEYSFCGNMFTEGQKVRMHAALTSSSANRNNLWQESNLTATGTDNGFIPVSCVPIADFRVDEKYICEGSSVSFTDFSWKGDSLIYDWSFPGGTPSTSNASNPVITYNTAGTYSATLTVSNATGSDNKTLNNVIIVRPIAAPSFAPASEDFENVGPIPNGSWLVDNEGGNTWEISNVAAFNGSHSARIYNFSGNVSGKTDNLITPSYNLFYLSNALLKFKMAYAVRSSGSTDQLRVFASTSCGQFWTQRFSKSGPLLSTSGLVTTDYVPANINQWREESVNISSGLFSGQPNVTFKFEYTHDTGNNLYIDDINISGIVSTGNEIETTGLNLFPNPTATTTRLEFTLNQEEHVTVKLLDVLGREIKIIAESKLPAGIHYTEIKDLEKAGVYFVKLIIGENEVVNKLVVR